MVALLLLTWYERQERSSPLWNLCAGRLERSLDRFEPTRKTFLDPGLASRCDRRWGRE